MIYIYTDTVQTGTAYVGFGTICRYMSKTLKVKYIQYLKQRVDCEMKLCLMKYLKLKDKHKKMERKMLGIAWRNKR